jgi:hypothetical protein
MIARPTHINFHPCNLVLECLEGGLWVKIHHKRSKTTALASFDTTPSPHRRINAPRLLLAFAHIHGEAGTPTEGIWNAVVCRNGPFLCAEEGVG